MYQTMTVSAEPKGEMHLSGSMLKMIAIVAMLIDHMAYTFVPLDSPLFTFLDLIGKTTGPIMFYFLVEGFHYTRSFWRYLTRMGIFAVISYVPFIYCFQGQLPNAENFLSFNILVTLFLCLLILKVRHSEWNPILKWSMIVVLIFCCTYCDWYYLAPIIVLIFDTYRGDFRNQACAYCFMALLLLGSGMFTVQWILRDRVFTQDPAAAFSNLSYYISMSGIFIPIFLLKFYDGKKRKNSVFSKWFFYAFYPAHLLILGIIHYGWPVFSF